MLNIVLVIAASVSYFKYQRPVQSWSAGQQYITVDDGIWQHARPDLGDLRLYSSSRKYCRRSSELNSRMQRTLAGRMIARGQTGIRRCSGLQLLAR